MSSLLMPQKKQINYKFVVKPKILCANNMNLIIELKQIQLFYYSPTESEKINVFMNNF